jgi:hypothetical protein
MQRNTKNFQEGNTKCGEVRNLQKWRTGKTSQLKNIIEDAFGFCFRWTWTCWKAIATSSRTSYKETKRSKKIGRCKVCKGLSSLRWCDQVTQSKAPLDSAAIYPITRSPNKHLETYLCLEHPAWSWWRCFMLPSSRHALLDHCYFVKTLIFSP